MITRSLGSTGIWVSAIGLGCMGMSGAYGPADEAESLATIQRLQKYGRKLDFRRRGPVEYRWQLCPNSSGR